MRHFSNNGQPRNPTNSYSEYKRKRQQEQRKRRKQQNRQTSNSRQSNKQKNHFQKHSMYGPPPNSPIAEMKAESADLKNSIQQLNHTVTNIHSCARNMYDQFSDILNNLCESNIRLVSSLEVIATRLENLSKELADI